MTRLTQQQYEEAQSFIKRHNYWLPGEERIAESLSWEGIKDRHAMALALALLCEQEAARRKVGLQEPSS